MADGGEYEAQGEYQQHEDYHMVEYQQAEHHQEVACPKHHYTTGEQTVETNFTFDASTQFQSQGDSGGQGQQHGEYQYVAAGSGSEQSSGSDDSDSEKKSGGEKQQTAVGPGAQYPVSEMRALSLQGGQEQYAAPPANATLQEQQYYGSRQPEVRTLLPPSFEQLQSRVSSYAAEATGYDHSAKPKEKKKKDKDDKKKDKDDKKKEKHKEGDEDSHYSWPVAASLPMPLPQGPDYGQPGIAPYQGHPGSDNSAYGPPQVKNKDTAQALVSPYVHVSGAMPSPYGEHLGKVEAQDKSMDGVTLFQAGYHIPSNGYVAAPHQTAYSGEVDNAKKEKKAKEHDRSLNDAPAVDVYGYAANSQQTAAHSGEVVKNKTKKEKKEKESERGQAAVDVYGYGADHSTVSWASQGVYGFGASQPGDQRGAALDPSSYVSQAPAGGYQPPVEAYGFDAQEQKKPQELGEGKKKKGKGEEEDQHNELRLQTGYQQPPPIAGGYPSREAEARKGQQQTFGGHALGALSPPSGYEPPPLGFPFGPQGGGIPAETTRGEQFSKSVDLHNDSRDDGRPALGVNASHPPAAYAPYGAQAEASSYTLAGPGIQDAANIQARYGPDPVKVDKDRARGPPLYAAPPAGREEGYRYAEAVQVTGEPVKEKTKVKKDKSSHKVSADVPPEYGGPHGPQSHYEAAHPTGQYPAYPPGTHPGPGGAPPVYGPSAGAHPPPHGQYDLGGPPHVPYVSEPGKEKHKEKKDKEKKSGGTPLPQNPQYGAAHPPAQHPGYPPGPHAGYSALPPAYGTSAAAHPAYPGQYAQAGAPQEVGKEKHKEKKDKEKKSVGTPLPHQIHPYGAANPTAQHPTYPPGPHGGSSYSGVPPAYGPVAGAHSARPGQYDEQGGAAQVTYVGEGGKERHKEKKEKEKKEKEKKKESTPYGGPYPGAPLNQQGSNYHGYSAQLPDHASVNPQHTDPRAAAYGSGQPGGYGAPGYPQTHQQQPSHKAAVPQAWNGQDGQQFKQPQTVQGRNASGTGLPGTGGEVWQGQQVQAPGYHQPGPGGQSTQPPPGHRVPTPPDIWTSPAEQAARWKASAGQAYANPPQYGRPATPPQYGRPATPPQYNRPATPPQYNRPGTPTQYAQQAPGPAQFANQGTQRSSTPQNGMPPVDAYYGGQAAAPQVYNQPQAPSAYNGANPSAQAPGPAYDRNATMPSQQVVPGQYAGQQQPQASYLGVQQQQQPYGYEPSGGQAGGIQGPQQQFASAGQGGYPQQQMHNRQAFGRVQQPQTGFGGGQPNYAATPQSGLGTGVQASSNPYVQQQMQPAAQQQPGLLSAMVGSLFRGNQGQQAAGGGIFGGPQLQQPNRAGGVSRGQQVHAAGFQGNSLLLQQQQNQQYGQMDNSSQQQHNQQYGQMDNSSQQQQQWPQQPLQDPQYGQMDNSNQDFNGNQHQDNNQDSSYALQYNNQLSTAAYQQDSSSSFGGDSTFNYDFGNYDSSNCDGNNISYY